MHKENDGITCLEFWSGDIFKLLGHVEDETCISRFYVTNEVYGK
jgi:hypothetical protein